MGGSQLRPAFSHIGRPGREPERDGEDVPPGDDGRRRRGSLVHPFIAGKKSRGQKGAKIEAARDLRVNNKRRACALALLDGARLDDGTVREFTAEAG